MNRLPQKEILAALDQAHDGFMISDPQSRVLYFNKAYAHFTRLDGFLQIGSRITELHRHGLVPSASCMEAATRGVSVSQIHFTAKKRSAIVSASTPFFDEEGRVIRVVTNVRDVSELIGLKDQMEEVQNIIAHLSQEVNQNQEIQRQGVVAASQAMQAVLCVAESVATVDANVLIQGESGVGKEAVAQFIHHYSLRRDKPFLAVNCGAIPENLIESELFGYTDGTFTGQLKGGKRGLIHAAEGGTLLLDEVGDMPLPLQVKLLRFLDSKTYLPLGASRPVSADVRIISATKRDLEQMVREGTFREDLYYRLNVVNLLVPALRERREDIIPLVLYFLAEANLKYHMKKIIPPFVLSALYQYDWLGNVREVRNVVERMVIMSPGQSCELPPGFFEEKGERVHSVCKSDVVPWRYYMAQQEKAYLIHAYHKCGTTRKTAEILGIDHSTLIRKMKRHGISAIK